MEDIADIVVNHFGGKTDAIAGKDVVTRHLEIDSVTAQLASLRDSIAVEAARLEAIVEMQVCTLHGCC